MQDFPFLVLQVVGKGFLANRRRAVCNQKAGVTGGGKGAFSNWEASGLQPKGWCN